MKDTVLYFMHSKVQKRVLFSDLMHNYISFLFLLAYYLVDTPNYAVQNL